MEHINLSFIVPMHHIPPPLKPSSVFILYMFFIAQYSAHASLKNIDFDALNTEIAADDRVCVLTSPLQTDADPFTILIALTTGLGGLKLQNILQKDIYCHTNPIVNRSLQTIPSLSPLVQDPPIHCWAITVKPFVTYTNKQNFTKNSTQVCSYLNLSTDFLEDIDLDTFTQLDIPAVLPLFGNIQLQLRQLGGMFFFQGQDEYWVTTLSMPVLLQATNYFLSEQEQKRIEGSSLFSGSGTPLPLVPSRDFNTFTEDHLIYDQLGIGDLRMEVWYKAADSDRGSVECGVQATFPTAHAVLIGMLGAPKEALCKKKPIPYVDIQSMFLLYTQYTGGNKSSGIELTEMVVDLGIAALDRLSSILLNQSLGQQHVSLGPVFRAIAFTPRQGFAIEVTGELSYFIPGHEIRFFKTIKDPQAFNRDYDNPDPVRAQENLNFLMQEATNTLYPTAVKINVHPGVIANLTVAVYMLREKFSAMIGYNFWAKSKEHFGDVDTRFPVCDPCAAEFSKPRYIDGPLNFKAGTLTTAWQNKLFANITSVIRSHHSYDARIGLRADGTFASSAIGRDFVIALDFIIDF